MLSELNSGQCTASELWVCWAKPKRFPFEETHILSFLRPSLEEAISREHCGREASSAIRSEARVLYLDVVAFDRDERRRGCFEDTAIQTATELDKLDQFDVLIEATGDSDALHTILANIHPGAIILLLGLCYSRREFTFEHIVAYDKIIVGSVGSSGEDFEEAIRLLRELPLDPFLEDIVPLSGFADAWRCFRQGEDLKTLLQIGV